MYPLIGHFFLSPSFLALQTETYLELTLFYHH